MTEQITLPLFLNNLRQAVVIAKPDGQVLVKNDIFHLLFIRGVGSENIFELFRENPLVLEAGRKVAEIRGSYSLREIPVRLPYGAEKTMDVEAFPLVGPKGELLSVNLLFYDRSGEAHFEAHQKRLDRLHYLRTIAAGLAHEIKNPLSGIRGASQLLGEGLKENEELSEYAEMIQKEVKRVDRLLTDLLHFTKPRTLKKGNVNVNQILHELVLLQKTVDPATAEFLEEFDPSLPPIQADAEALHQIFLNLIKNARQALGGKGRVTVRSRIVTDFVLLRGDTKRKFIGVDVEDSGCGIDEETLPNIFVPFFTTKPKGSGLGLAVCHQLVEEHEGDIRVKSEKGRGTVFSVYLPV